MTSPCTVSPCRGREVRLDTCACLSWSIAETNPKTSGKVSSARCSTLPHSLTHNWCRHLKPRTQWGGGGISAVFQQNKTASCLARDNIHINSQHSAGTAGCKRQKWFTLFPPAKTKGVTVFIWTSREGEAGGRGLEEAAGDKKVWQAWRLRENATPGLVLDVNKRMIHQKVTGQKDGYYPGEEEDEEEEEEKVTIFSSGVKICTGFI